MKKLLTSLMVAMMVFSLVACSNGTKDEPEATPSSDVTVASDVNGIIDEIKSQSYTTTCFIEHPSLGEVECTELVNASEDETVKANQEEFATALFDHEYTEADSSTFHSDDLLAILSYKNAADQPVMLYYDNQGGVKVTINRGDAIYYSIGSSISDAVIGVYDAAYPVEEVAE